MTTPSIESTLEHATWLIKQQSHRVSTQIAMWKVYNLQWDKAKLTGAGNEWLVVVADPQPHSNVRTAANIITGKDPSIKIRIPQEAIDASLLEKTSALFIAGWRLLPKKIREITRPITPTEKMQETFENLIRFSIHQNDERRDGVLARELALDGLVTDQIATICLDRRLLQPEFDLEGKSPFILERVDPTTFYSEYDDAGIATALRRYIRPLRDVKRMYGDKIRGDTDALKDDNQLVLFSEKWWREKDKYWKCAWIEKSSNTSVTLSVDDLIRQMAWIYDDGEIQENPLGFIPFNVVTCNGHGQEIDPLLWALHESGMDVSNNVALTLQTSLPIKFANPQATLEGAEIDEVLPVLDYTKQNVIPLRKDQKLNWLEAPQNKEIAPLLTMLQEKGGDAVGVPKILTGWVPGARAAAGLYALASSAAERIINPVVVGLNAQYRWYAHRLFDYLATYAEIDKENGSKLEVWTDGGKTIIEAGKLPQWKYIEIEFQPDMPQDKIAYINAAMQAHSMNWLPLKQTYKMAKFDDINEIMDEWDEQNGNTDNPQQPPAPDRLRVGSALLPTLGNLPPGTLAPNQAQGFPPGPTQPQQNPLSGIAKMFKRGAR